MHIDCESPILCVPLVPARILTSVAQGTLIGTIVDWATAPRPDRSSYLIPLGLVYVVPLAMSVALYFIPESPRWLILQGRREEGRKALQWLRPAGVPVDAEVDQIEAAIHKEREMGSSVGVLDMFRNPIDRRRTMISVAGVTTQAASGSMFIIGRSHGTCPRPGNSW